MRELLGAGCLWGATPQIRRSEAGTRGQARAGTQPYRYSPRLVRRLNRVARPPSGTGARRRWPVRAPAWMPRRLPAILPRTAPRIRLTGDLTATMVSEQTFEPPESFCREPLRGSFPRGDGHEGHPCPSLDLEPSPSRAEHRPSHPSSPPSAPPSTATSRGPGRPGPTGRNGTRSPRTPPSLDPVYSSVPGRSIKYNNTFFLSISFRAW